MLALLTGALALRSLDLIDDEGKNVFPGGPQEAGCAACFSTMEQMERHLAEPFNDGIEAKVRDRTEAEKKRVAKLNEEMHIQKAIDPNRCKKAMEGYDLAHVNNRNTWIRRPDDGNMGYPVPTAPSPIFRRTATPSYAAIQRGAQPDIASLRTTTRLLCRKKHLMLGAADQHRSERLG